MSLDFKAVICYFKELSIYYMLGNTLLNVIT